MNRLIQHLLKLLPAFLLTGVSLFLVTSAYAETYKATSSKHPVGLIELYTSQGCSSCPPAEKWLGELEQRGIKGDQAVPLALHVDYWDYIGWKDQFAQKYFTARQYQYRKTNHSASVYTPQIMFNGNDVRGVGLENGLNDLKSKQAAVSFNVRADTINNNRLKVAIDFDRIDPVAKNSRLVVVLAENNLVGHIDAGENEGRMLKHNHVVRLWKNMGQVRSKHSLELPINPNWKRDNLEVVVIVETADMQTQQALQLALK